MISKWNYLPLTSNEQQIARTLGDRYPKVPALCKLLAQRGVTSAAEAEKFSSDAFATQHTDAIYFSKRVNSVFSSLFAYLCLVE